MSLTDLRLAYVPASKDASAPGDRRRFPGWAKRRGLSCDLIDRPDDRYDVVVLSQYADYSIWSRYTGRSKIVFDMIDSYIALPRTDLKALLRGTAKSMTGQFARFTPNYWEAIRRMCRRADAVVCATEEQRSRVIDECVNVHVILDLQDSEAQTVKSSFTANRPFRLVWEGQAQNVVMLAQLAPVVRRLSATQPIAMHLVTDPEYFMYMGRYGRRSTLETARRYFDDVELHPWTAGALSRVATSSDLAVIPIPLDDELARGKPENKLLLFWRMGVPAIVSATPAYRRAIEASGSGVVCETEADWENALRRSIDDETFRRVSGIRGREYALREQGDERLLERWDAAIESLYATVA